MPKLKPKFCVQFKSRRAPIEMQSDEVDENSANESRNSSVAQRGSSSESFEDTTAKPHCDKTTAEEEVKGNHEKKSDSVPGRNKVNEASDEGNGERDGNNSQSPRNISTEVSTEGLVHNTVPKTSKPSSSNSSRDDFSENNKLDISKSSEEKRKSETGRVTGNFNQRHLSKDDLPAIHSTYSSVFYILGVQQIVSKVFQSVLSTLNLMEEQNIDKFTVKADDAAITDAESSIKSETAGNNHTPKCPKGPSSDNTVGDSAQANEQGRFSEREDSDSQNNKPAKIEKPTKSFASNQHDADGSSSKNSVKEKIEEIEDMLRNKSPSCKKKAENSNQTNCLKEKYGNKNKIDVFTPKSETEYSAEDTDSYEKIPSSEFDYDQVSSCDEAEVKSENNEDGTTHPLNNSFFSSTSPGSKQKKGTHDNELKESDVITLNCETSVIVELFQKIDELQNENAKMKHASEEDKKAIEKLQFENTEIKKECNGCIETIEQLSNARIKICESNNDYTKTITTLQDEINKLKQDNKENLETISILKSENKEINQKFGKSKDLILKHNLERKAIDDKLDSVMLELGTKKASLASTLIKYLPGIKTEPQEHTTVMKIEIIFTGLKQLQATIAKLQQTLENRDAEFMGVQNKYFNALAETKTLRKTFDKKTAAQTELIRDRDEQLKNLEYDHRKQIQKKEQDVTQWINNYNTVSKQAEDQIQERDKIIQTKQEQLEKLEIQSSTKIEKLMLHLQREKEKLEVVENERLILHLQLKREAKDKQDIIQKLQNFRNYVYVQETLLTKEKETFQVQLDKMSNMITKFNEKIVLEDIESEAENNVLAQAFEEIDRIRNDAKQYQDQITMFRGSREDRTYLHVKEMLLRALQKLDNVDSQKRDEIQNWRKDAIIYVKKLLDELEKGVKSQRRY